MAAERCQSAARPSAAVAAWYNQAEKRRGPGAENGKDMGSLSSPVTRAIRRVFLYVATLAAISALGTAALADPPKGPEEEWLGSYFGTQYIGYESTLTTPTTVGGQPVLRVVSHGVTKMTVLGSTVEENENSVTIADMHYRPLDETEDVRSNGNAIHIVAHFDYVRKLITCQIGEGSEIRHKTIHIPDGANLAIDEKEITRSHKLATGDKFVFSYLDPLTVELEQATLEVTGRDQIHDVLTDKDMDALIVKITMPLGSMTGRVDEDGNFLRGDIALGPASITMARMSKSQALDPSTPAPAPLDGAKPYTPPKDFAVATSVHADRPIAHPRTLRELDVTVTGIPDKDLILSDSRQQVQSVTEDPATQSYTAHMDITASVFPAANSATLPITDPAVQSYLQDSYKLNIDDPRIKATAAQLKGSERNAYKVAVAIRNWVHRIMTYDATLGLQDSATDIYKKRRGVCRDYATLYTSLARAAGIPTRVCAGIVAADGSFYYHAWAESYVGKWVTMDPTIYDPSVGDLVDATHIKFSQGDVNGMYNVIKVVGKIGVTVNRVAP